MDCLALSSNALYTSVVVHVVDLFGFRYDAVLVEFSVDTALLRYVHVAVGSNSASTCVVV